MRAVVFDEFGAPPSVRDVPEPVCPPDGVLLRVAATGLCRSDWHGWLGHDADIRLPHVPGHEFAGVVAEVARDVRRWRVGDRVTAPFVCACGRCPTCRRGEEQVCERQQQPGFTHWGSFAELVVIDVADLNVVRLPDDMDFDTAAGLGCRFATAYRAVVHHARLAPGEWLAVHGCGGVGLSAVMIAVAGGARVVAVDPTPAARARAEELGAEAVLEPDGCVRAIRELTGGGAAASIDAIGGPDTLANSVGGLARRGRHVQVGLLGAAATIPARPIGQAIARELTLIGSHGMAARDYPAMLERVTSGDLDPGRLVRRVIGLDEAAVELAALGTAPIDGVTIIHPN
ncbi:MAG TPA: zinc-dependent alcohol dehydrogenase family protein [Jatrophihabitantaceae bacterium]